MRYEGLSAIITLLHRHHHHHYQTLLHSSNVIVIIIIKHYKNQQLQMVSSTTLNYQSKVNSGSSELKSVSLELSFSMFLLLSLSWKDYIFVIWFETIILWIFSLRRSVTRLNGMFWQQILFKVPTLFNPVSIFEMGFLHMMIWCHDDIMICWHDERWYDVPNYFHWQCQF